MDLASVNVNGCNALHFVCNAQRLLPRIEMTLRLIDLLPEVALNQKPLDGQLRGQTPLHIVSGGRDVEDGRHRVIAKLVNAKADIEARDLNGRTPLLVTGGAAYKKGAEILHALGADMMATKPGGRNFADEAMGSNKRLARWWCDISGLQPSGVAAQARAGIYKRDGVSEQRYNRLAVRRAGMGEGNVRQSRAACSQTWGNDAWEGGDWRSDAWQASDVPRARAEREPDGFRPAEREPESFRISDRDRDRERDRRRAEREPDRDREREREGGLERKS